MDRKIGIGIVGLGYMGFHHLKILNALIESSFVEGLTIERVFDPDEKRLEEVSSNHNIGRPTRSFEEIIADEEVNTIFIASPTKFHKEQLEMAIEAGKAVYGEKPLCVTSEEAFDLSNKARQANIPNQSGLVLRHSPTCEYVYGLLQTKEFGDVKWVNYRHDAAFPIDGIYRGDWKLDKEMSGGGILKEANIHDIDLILRWFGNFDVIRTEMELEKREIESAVYTELISDQGVKINFSTLWHNIKGRGTSRRVEIFCDEGMIIADDFMFYGPITYQKNGERPVTVPRGEIYKRYLEKEGIDVKFKQFKHWYSSLAIYAFLNSVINQTSCYPNFNIAAEADKKVEEIYSCAEPGKNKKC